MSWCHLGLGIVSGTKIHGPLAELFCTGGGRVPEPYLSLRFCIPCPGGGGSCSQPKFLGLEAPALPPPLGGRVGSSSSPFRGGRFTEGPKILVFEPSCFAFWPLLGGVFQHFITFLKLKYLNFVSTLIFGSFLWFLVIFTLPGAEGAEENFSACTRSQPTPPYPRGGGV